MSRIRSKCQQFGQNDKNLIKMSRIRSKRQTFDQNFRIRTICRNLIKMSKTIENFIKMQKKS